jgi:hypothetical protein
MRRLRIDHAGRLVTIECAGALTDSDLQIGPEEYGTVESHYSFLVDLTRVEMFKVTADGLRRLAGYSGPSQHWKAAIVAPADVAFGLARMFQTYTQNPGIAVFRGAVAAREWVEVHNNARSAG